MHSTVWKMIYLARRNPQLSAEAFPQAWREHSALGRQCRNVGQRVQAVAQCARVLHADAPALSRDHDGVNLMVLADRASGQLIWEDPETLCIMRPDEPRVFADYVRNFALLCKEHVLVDTHGSSGRPQNGQVILIGFLQRNPCWQGPAAVPSDVPALWKASGLSNAQRIVCNTTDTAGPVSHEFRYIVEWWFDSLEQALEAAAGIPKDAKGGEHAWGEAVFVLTEVTHSRS